LCHFSDLRISDMTTSSTWKAQLQGQMPLELADDIDIFATQIELKRQGKIDERVFAETRLRRGVYGQRYDNGQRHDGVASQALAYPSGELTKGPQTVWDAPGMQRIKIPFGGLTAEQMEVLADLAEEYSDNILHVTTRQDFQLHFIHIEDTPDIMRRLAAVGITTQEACGNVVRNVAACPLAGVCSDESFDVTPYARALAFFLLGHKDTQDFGRKFKISFSGCSQHACGLASMHDLGLIARRRIEDGQERRGFEFYVGGGLGAVPHQAQLFDAFVPEDELLPLTQAVCRVFARLGEKKNRARARLKFLITKLGMDEFRRLVLAERAIIPAEEQWTSYLDDLHITDERPSRAGEALGLNIFPDGFTTWQESNVLPQVQAGYAVATVALPLGDLTSQQMRALADIARHYNGGHTRTTVDQNIVLRWISQADLPALYTDLKAVGLAEAGAATLTDITACPGTDTCKLGIASSRGLAAELRHQIGARNGSLDDAVKHLKIKISGCFNSCGQHHVADIGFYGVSRKVGSHAVPHFQVVLGGQWSENAGAYGLATVAIPSKQIPQVVDRLVDFYVQQRQADEPFQAFIKRVGKAKLRALLDDLTQVPDYVQERSFYSDWGDPREYSLGDLGVGECAGEVVSLTQFSLAASERQIFEAQVQLDEGRYEQAYQTAYAAMLQAAKALVQVQQIDIGDDATQIVHEFRTRFYDTELFFDPFAGGKFANYLLHAYENGDAAVTPDAVHRRIEEVQLFIEAAHACYNRLSQQLVAIA
jgi:sulfite reductase (ferredoxin)